MFCLIVGSLPAQTTDDLLNKAEQFRDSSQWDSAIYFYDLALNLFSNDQRWAEAIEAGIKLNRIKVDALEFEEARLNLSQLLTDARSKLPARTLTEAHVLDALGNLANEMGDYSAGSKQLQKSLSIKTELKLKGDDIGGTYFNLGNSYRAMGKFDNAASNYQLALEIRKRLFGEQSVEAALVLNNLAIIHSNKREFDQALEIYLVCDSIVSVQLGSEHKKRAAILNGIAIVYAQTGRFPEALTYFNQLLQIDLKTLGSDNPYLAKTYTNLGILHELMGDYKTAQELHKKSLAIKLKSFEPDNPNLISDYKGLAIVMNNLGDVDQAILFQKQVLQMEQKAYSADDPTIGVTYNLLGIALMKKGDFPLAWEYLEKAEQIFLKNGSSFPELGPVYHTMASFLEQQDRPEEALPFAYKALSINRRLGESHPHVAGNHQLIGNIFFDLGALDSAAMRFQKSLEINKRIFGDRHLEVSQTYARIARLLATQKRFPEALEQISLAIESSTDSVIATDYRANPLVNQTSIPNNLASILGEKGLILKEYAQESNNHDYLSGAMAAFGAAISMIDAAQFSYKTQGSVATLREEFDPVYEHAIEVAYLLYSQTKDPEYLNRAFQYSEKNKSALLVSALNESRAQEFAKIPKELLDKESQLKRELVFFEQQLIDERNNENAQPEFIAELQTKIFRHKSSYDELIEDFGKNYPEYYQLKYNAESISIEDVNQNLVNGKEILIEYFFGNEALYIFVFTGNENGFYRIESNEELNSAIDDLRSQLENDTGDPSSFAEVSTRLYGWLIKPFEGTLGNQKLTIIPDGKLGYIPFEILLDNKDKSIFSFDLDYLFKRHAISYAYSATYLENRLVGKTANKSLRYLAFSPNFNSRNKEGSAEQPDLLAFHETVRGSLAELNGAKREVEALAEYFEGDFYRDMDAQESRFKKLAGQYEILHLATHAIIDEINPYNSRLLFTIDGDTIDDGDLHAWELFNMNLNADLAVLSACNTGFGRIQKGEGVLSLGRAFAYAGCPSRLMSLWPAQDASTADIMATFYRFLSKGSSKDEALRQARMEYLQNAEEFTMHPFYWAGFVIQGDPSPIIAKSYLLPATLWFAAVAFLLYIFGRLIPFLLKKERAR